MFPADVAIITSILIIAAIDVAFILDQAPTISKRFRDIGRKVSFLPYSWGVLGGHFWGPTLPPAFGGWWASIGFLLVGGAVVTAGHFLILRVFTPPGWLSLVYLPFGAVAGIVLWPQ